jgi:hypothetical protein
VSRGSQQWRRAGGIVVVIKPKKEIKLVSKKKEINDEEHT